VVRQSGPSGASDGGAAVGKGDGVAANHGSPSIDTIDA
jgi:hypothetical protein